MLLAVFEIISTTTTTTQQQQQQQQQRQRQQPKFVLFMPTTIVFGMGFSMTPGMEVKLQHRWLAMMTSLTYLRQAVQGKCAC